MDYEQLFRIVSLDNSDMVKMLKGLFSESVKASHFVSLHQNDFKERALAMYEEFKKTYKKGHYAQLYFGRINQMDLEEEAHRYGISMTLSTLAEFTDIDNAILEQHMKIVNESPKSFLTAMIDVLGSGSSLPQTAAANSLPPEIVSTLLELHDLLKRKGVIGET